jgi:5-methylcytosine-specific restriction endonuclease McrA
MSPPPFDSLSDDELHAAVRRLTARSNIALADLLAHLGEVETRGIHRILACASLYTYCIYELRMSEDEAYRRAKAARLVHQHPELRDIVARGEIHLTGLLMIAPYLGGERHAQILERTRFRSKREIARLIAEIDPKPEAPPLIEPVGPPVAGSATTEAFHASLAGPVRRLPDGDRPGDWVEREAEAHGATGGTRVAGGNGAHDPASQELAEAERALDGARRARPETLSDRPLRYKVQFTAGQEYVELLEEAFALLGCKPMAASLPDVQLRALRELVERLRKRKQGAPIAHAGTSDTAPERVGEMPMRVSAARPSQPGPSRYIPVAVRRAVWARDASRCAYTDERGVRCSETRGLELHHRDAYALGGPATVQNVELRCVAHNLLAAEQDFGRAHMDRRRGVQGAEAAFAANANGGSG